jgi:psiF repeat
MNPAPAVVAALALIAGGSTLAAEMPAAPSATPVKHPTVKSCNREASAKKLSGKEREQYVKDCTTVKAPADAKTR